MGLDGEGVYHACFVKATERTRGRKEYNPSNSILSFLVSLNENKKQKLKVN